jgi:hypothetical protein
VAAAQWAVAGETAGTDVTRAPDRVRDSDSDSDRDIDGDSGSSSDSGRERKREREDGRDIVELLLDTLASAATALSERCPSIEPRRAVDAGDSGLHHTLYSHQSQDKENDMDKDMHMHMHMHMHMDFDMDLLDDRWATSRARAARLCLSALAELRYSASFTRLRLLNKQSSASADGSISFIRLKTNTNTNAEHSSSHTEPGASTKPKTKVKASDLRFRAAWLLSSVLRYRLRWLLDPPPPFISAPAK